MKLRLQRNHDVPTIVQTLLVFAWLTILSPLSVTDTYYSVYLLCGVVGLLCLWDNYRLGASCSRGQGWVLGVASCLFSLAVVMANYELFTPLSVLENLFDTLCCLAGGVCVAYPVLLWMRNRLPLAADTSPRPHPGRVFFLTFASIAAIDLAYLFFARYPGALTTDSITTIQQLMGDEAYDNVMPFWHTVTVQVFVKLGLALFGDINAAVALFHGAQILFMAACFGYVLVTLYQTGVPKPVLVLVYALYAFMPYNIAYSVTLWKDIPFAGAAVLFVTAFYRLLKGVGKHKAWNYTAFIIGALGFSLWRTNGWYAFAVTVLVMLFLLGKKQKKLLILMIAVLLLCWVLLNPVLDLLGVGGTNFVEAFAVPMQQIARIVSGGRELTGEETALLSEIFWLDKLGDAYDPLTVDPVKFETFRYDQVDYIRENLGQYLRLYGNLGLRYPADYLKAWIDETKGYWNGGYFFWIYTKGISDNIYGLEASYGENAVASAFSALFRYVEKLTILQPLTSIGLHVWVLLGCFLTNLLKKREEFLLSIPIFVLVVGLWLGTPVYAEFRYAYPIILTLPVILLSTVYRVKE